MKKCKRLASRGDSFDTDLASAIDLRFHDRLGLQLLALNIDSKPQMKEGSATVQEETTRYVCYNLPHILVRDYTLFSNARPLYFHSHQYCFTLRDEYSLLFLLSPTARFLCRKQGTRPSSLLWALCGYTSRLLREPMLTILQVKDF